LDDVSTTTPASAEGLVLPGFVNAHSHAFQRALRGRAEGGDGDFWSWRERMYELALVLEPDEFLVVCRAAFLEMALAGFTGVIEFHYLHHGPDGTPYEDPNTLARCALEAAAQVGIRICVIETAYARSGEKDSLTPAQQRFSDPTLDDFVRRAEDLKGLIAELPGASFGLGLHSVRALPARWLKELAHWARSGDFPVHMHVAEQRGEVDACLAEHGRRPVELLHDLGLLSERFTAVHAVHSTKTEIEMLAARSAGVCACPSTEANLGDGFIPAALLIENGVPLCVGTDSHASIDPFAELRELDYRERLRTRSRGGVGPPALLLEWASHGGARRAGWVRALDDRVVLDPSHPALAGADAESLSAYLVVAGSPAVVKDVYVGGRQIVADGRHEKQEEILRDFAEVQRRLWGG
jgi:formimidoylglutamate deiminase